MRIIKYIITWTIIIGLIGFAINKQWPNTISFLSKEFNSFSTAQPYWKYDFREYVKNLGIAAQKTTDLAIELPTRKWESDGWELISILDDIINNLCVMLDWGLFAINIMLFPFRVICYLVQILIAFVGINIDPTNNNAFSWLIKLTNYLIPIKIGYI